MVLRKSGKNILIISLTVDDEVATPSISPAKKVFVEADKAYSIERVDTSIKFKEVDKFDDNYVIIRPKTNTIKYKGSEWYYK